MFTFFKFLQIPSIALAYEKAENDIMTRKPRNPYKDRLVNMQLLSYSYFHIGKIPQKILTGLWICKQYNETPNSYISGKEVLPNTYKDSCSFYYKRKKKYCSSYRNSNMNGVLHYSMLKQMYRVYACMYRSILTIKDLSIGPQNINNTLIKP